MAPHLVTRRRMFSILAGCTAVPAVAAPVQSWQGKAMGADAQILLAQQPKTAGYALFKKVEHIITQVEQSFSLHLDSELARLNATGLLRHPSQAMINLIALSARVHDATNGVFDPTIQPLWLALAKGQNPNAVRDRIGWYLLSVEEVGVRLARESKLTFNGIAQGFCADQVAALLRGEGFDKVLVNMGEISALGQNSDASGWPVSIADRDGHTLRTIPLVNRALATSSPFSLRLAGGEPHILGPHGEMPRWQTVSVSDISAAVADALSTAFCLMDRPAIDQALLHFPDARIEVLA